MKTLFTLILVIFFFSFGVYSQTSEKWKRIETDDLSISIPPTFIVDAEKKNNSQSHNIIAFQKGVSVEIEVSKPSDPKSRLKYLYMDKEFTNSAFKKGNFEIVRMSSKTKINEKIFLASKKNFYVIEITSSKSALENAQRILVSIKTENEPLFVQENSIKNLLGDEDLLKLGELKTSSEVTDTLARKYEKPQIAVVNKRLKEFVDDIDLSQLSRPPIIIDKPNPGFRPSLDSVGGPGFLAKLKVTFLANGKVGDIVTYSDSNSSFVSSCVEAAKKIKFLPANKDGNPIDSEFIVEYQIRSMIVATPGIRPF